MTKTTTPAPAKKTAPLKSFCFTEKGVTIQASSLSEAREILEKQEKKTEKK